MALAGLESGTATVKYTGPVVVEYPQLSPEVCTYHTYVPFWRGAPVYSNEQVLLEHVAWTTSSKMNEPFSGFTCSLYCVAFFTADHWNVGVAV